MARETISSESGDNKVSVTTYPGGVAALDVAILGADGNQTTAFPTDQTAYTTALDYSGGTNVIYVGEAVPGSAKTSAVWRIKKLTYDVNNNVTDVQYAGGASTFVNIWSNRATFTYS